MLRLSSSLMNKAVAAAVKGGSKRKKLTILGTGWASFRMLRDIDHTKYAVTVISPRNHLLFTPMLASSAVGTVNQRSICQPVRPLVAKKKARYYESQARAIDKKKKIVLCTTPQGDDYEIPYETLIIGVGFQPNDFNTPGVAEHALFMKETMDATVFKDHVLMRFEEASYVHALDRGMTLGEEEKQRLRDILTFIVVGGGPTGVELAGELSDFLNSEGAKLYGHLQEFISVHMFTYDLLNTFDHNLQEYAMNFLRKKQNVQIQLGAFVKEVTKDTVHVQVPGKNGGEPEMISMKYGTLAWCAGVKPHQFITDYGFQMNERGTQILTDGTLKVIGEEDIFAVGDCATIQEYWLPQTAQVAKQQAVYLSKQFNQGTAGKKKSFVFQSLGMMAYVGGFNAIMSKIPGVPNITGFLAFLGWRSVYWSLQLSIRNRFMIATDWVRTIVFGRDLTRFGPPSMPR